MVIGNTSSVCPVCLRQIPAERVQRGENVYLRKSCADHGEFETVVWRGADDAFSNWTSTFLNSGFSPAPQCPSGCADCASHQNSTCCALVEVTSRCNLRCPVCFADAGGEAKPDPTVAELETAFRELVIGGNTFLQLSGGEPTVRGDLPEIVAAARRAGAETVQLNSNGLRLAREPEFTQALANAGLSFVFLQFDGVTDDVYTTLRGEPLLAEKLRAIEVCGDAGLGVTLVPTLVPGVNDGQIGAILDLAVTNSPVVRGVHFQPVSYFGRYPQPPRDEDRITLPEVLRAIELQTQGKFKLRDFNPSSCDHPLCGFHGDFAVLPKGKLLKLTKKYNPDASCCDDKASDAHLKNRAFVARRWTRDAVSEREADDSLTENDDKPELSAFLRRVKSHGFTVSAMAFQDAYTLDLERLSRCSLSVFRGGKLLPFCANYLSAAEAPSAEPSKTERKSRHPGGLNLTERGLRLAQLKPGMRVLDVGCGDGVTVELLRNLGIDATGVEKAVNTVENSPYIFQADAIALPFADGEFDAVMFECSLSEMDDAIAALHEAERVVKPRGLLIMSDVFAKKQAPGLPWITDDIRKILKWAGFGITVAEDHTPALVTYAAEMFANNEPFCNGIDARQLGYCLVVAEKYK